MQHTSLLEAPVALSAATRFGFQWNVMVVKATNLLVVQFTLNTPARIRIVLGGIAGSRGKTLYDAPRRAGWFSEQWAMVDTGGRKLGPGVYMVSLSLDGEEMSETAVFKS